MQTISSPLPSPATLNENILITRIVHYLEDHPNAPIALDFLAEQFGVKRRGLYDFISISIMFGICQRHTSNSIEWHGIDHSESVLNTLRDEARRESTNQNLKDLFNNQTDPSLQRIAIGVVKLFFVLRVKNLDLRKVGRLFAQRTTKYKTMLRKLYTVAAGLELAGIVRRTTVVSEIQIVTRLAENHSGAQMGIGSILNTKEEIEEEQICEKRRHEFEAVCIELAQPAGIHGIQQRLRLLEPVAMPPWH
jgi:hypothetical protein